MKLPPWKDLLKYFPNKEAGKVFTEIGGKVKLNYDIGVFTNACATRISRTLNLVGGPHSIPYYKTKSPSGKEQVQVSSGSLKNWYIFRVKVLIQYLTEKYGSPKQSTAGKYKQDFNGKKGIITFEVSGWSDASGHADLWDGKKCIGSDYGSKSTRILFWEAF